MRKRKHNEKIGNYPNHVLRSGMSGGGLTIGDCDNESNWGRVYILRGRLGDEGYSVLVAASLFSWVILSR